MSAGASLPPIPLPASLGRSLRLGPFPSGRAAAKFAGYSAIGLLVATLVSPLAGAPLVGVGFLLTAFAPGGEPLDARVVRVVQWGGRRLAPREPDIGRRRPVGDLARLSDGRWVGALTTGGVPVAFLPPDAARRLFDDYRAVLQGLDGGLFLRVTEEPIVDRPFRLPAAPADATEAEAAPRAGYDELVERLCRKRQRRVVDLFLFAPGGDPDAPAGLERRLRALTVALRSLGLDPQRRVGRSLLRALQRVGWTLAGEA